MIVVKPLNETTFTASDLYALVTDAYQMWTEHGLDEPWMHRSLEEFKASIADVYAIYVALDADTAELLGMHCFRANLKKKRAMGFYLAVSPKAQRRGITKQLEENGQEQLRQAGFTHIVVSTTATAQWAVTCHQKNGYRIIGCKRDPQLSYIFRKQLKPVSLTTLITHPVYSLYSSPLFCRFKSWLSSLRLD